MSLKNSYTTSDYLQWDTATTLVRKLYRDKNYRISLFIGCGIFFGLRVSDLLRLNWNMLLNKEAKFVLIEKKTGKRREVKINREFQKHIKDCYQALHINNMDELCFLSIRNKVYSIQWINLILKELSHIIIFTLKNLCDIIIRMIKKYFFIFFIYSWVLSLSWTPYLFLKSLISLRMYAWYAFLSFQLQDNLSVPHPV